MSETSTAIDDGTGSKNGAPIDGLIVKGVHYAYTMRKGEPLEIFSDISFSARPGEFVSIVGPSGCGKSTMLRILCGLVRPTAGTVTLGGAPVTGRTAKAAMVFQDDRLLPWRTAIKNVCFSIENDKPAMDIMARSRRALKMVGLGDFTDRFPNQLSGGMRQRVNLARALVSNPQLLLMDEPFAALDAQSRETHQMSLQEIWAETRKTVIFVTHDLDEAIMLSDRVVVLGQRGSGIVEDVHIPVPRPRVLDMRHSPEFIEISRRLRHLLTHDDSSDQ
ncbi:ABC transporter ATP-binding protein [Pseudonocardia lutea]|uniref:ABC transporter ATP-binding protein n=1 Tax=Pseudonocardia lutea TaxID=2172015 RepID=A0ABW1IIT7_9PSEU